MICKEDGLNTVLVGLMGFTYFSHYFSQVIFP